MTKAKAIRRPSFRHLKSLSDRQPQEVVRIAGDEQVRRKLQDAKNVGRAPFFMDEDGALAEALLAACKAQVGDLERLYEEVSGHWAYIDGLYRFYHQSFKVFYLQGQTLKIREGLQRLMPDLPLPDCAPEILNLKAKPKNERRWRVQSDFEQGDGNPENTLEARRARLCDGDEQGVNTFVAEHWTLEYDLSLIGLEREVFLAACLAKNEDPLNESRKTRDQVLTEAAREWTEIVTACPKHHIKLVNSCDCDPAKAHSSLKSKHLPHICGLCGNSLALRPGIPAEAANEAELHRATLVAELLGSNLFEPNGCTGQCAYQGAGIVLFLQVAVLIVGEECAARTASLLGVSKGTLSGWLNHHHLPSLSHAVSIAEVFKVPMAKILVGEGSGDYSSLRPKDIQRIAHRRRLRGNCSKDELERKLLEILNADIPVSGREAARITGCSNRGHYLSFPELSRAIAKRSLDQQYKDAQRRREEGLLHIREAAMQLANEGFIPTRKRLEERIKGVSTFFLSNERDECRRICLEVREEILFPKRSSR